MEMIVAAQQEPGVSGDAAFGSESPGISARFDRVAVWMIILGTARLVSGFGQWLSEFFEMNRAAVPTVRSVGWFLRDNPPVIVLAMCWPLVLGQIIRKTQNRRFMPVAALTFMILAVGGFLNVVDGMSLRSDGRLVVGSLNVSRHALARWSPSAVARALMGAVQLALELGTAVAAWALSQPARRKPVTAKAASGPAWRRVHGRLAFYVTLTFLAVSMRGPLWSAYLAIVDRSDLVRTFILKNDPRTANPYRGRLAARGLPPMGLMANARKTQSSRLADTNRMTETKAFYQQTIARLESARSGSDLSQEERLELAQALNNLAWLLVTCEDSKLWKPREAVDHARRAVKLDSQAGNYWNTLGAACFRSGEWDDARKALDRSMELRAGTGDAFDWFFLAMIDGRQKSMIDGRKWYDKAVSWFHEARPGDVELYRFQVEAARVLQLPTPEPPIAGPNPGQAGPPFGPIHPRHRISEGFTDGSRRDG